MSARRLGLVLACALACAATALAERPAGSAAGRAAGSARAGRAGPAVVVPDRFLRRWDPVTVFFDRDRGPEEPGPEDHPEKLVRLSPAQPGAFDWIDPRTLRFRPAEPWPPLSRFTVEVVGSGRGAAPTELATLLSAPSSSLPEDGASALDEVRSITLTLPEPIDPEVLRRMLSIELAPLPGIRGAETRRLGRDDFGVKALERRARSEAARYVVDLRAPIPPATSAVVKIRLSLDEDAAESAAEIHFTTAEPFRVTGVGCPAGNGRGGGLYPVTPAGSRYGRDQALDCGSGDRRVVVEFSSAPRALGPVEARSLVRFTPAVDDLEFAVSGTRLEVSGSFAWDTLYRVALEPVPLSDLKGRPLDARGESEVHVYFPRRPAYLRWGASQGIIERLGAQKVPVDGRGKERLDLRIHKIDPLDRSFWPFPAKPVEIDESKRPPGPGEEPEPYTKAERSISAVELAEHVASLGTPPVSRIVDLPLRQDRGAATFGLDLSRDLAAVAGPGKPGTYLVGLRSLDGSNERSWMRVQVTDLVLTTIEEPQSVRFVVTSLATGEPVAGAEVAIEGALDESGQRPRWVTHASGTTGAAGEWAWPAPGWRSLERRTVRRIVVRKADDVLVLDPAHPPDRFHDGVWSPGERHWLAWAFESLASRAVAAETVCHVFTERPVYRPDDTVHIKGWVRRREKGALTPVQFDGVVVVEGPGEDQVWRTPVSLSPAGSFYHAFAEANLPTGDYAAHLEDEGGHAFCKVAFKLDAYRVPTFEVKLHAPDVAPLDAPFDVALTASYYAGGRVAGRPVEWRVTQFPYPWMHEKREGFFYSSDGRFSATGKFESTPRLDRRDATGDDGGATLALDPSVEPTAQPRTYVVEATVTGADDQTVTAVKRVHALPSFVLGVKVPRFLERARVIEPEVIVVDPEGKKLLAGKPVTVRLLHRQWHSRLRAADFTQGVAKYVTDVVDEKVSETTVESGGAPVRVSLPIAEAGVYVVELEARDRLGRAQVVAVDLYAGGNEAVAWQRPATAVFDVATDKDAYDPGATAALLLKSPFQRARALAVVEAPAGNRYEWLDVKGGKATLALPIDPSFAPRVPVHFVLLRGRLAGAPPGPTDLGKPATFAATKWLEVNPTGNLVKVEIESPARAEPRARIEVKVKLRDAKGKPRSGEVALWLVDQAVLSLGREQTLDPIPDLVTAPASRLTIRDTRNLGFGEVPFAEAPGGDQGEAPSLFDRTTVRRLFKAVPFYAPAIRVGDDGDATVTIELADDLTNFKIRAKAASGPDRFGFATAELAVRLPVVVQPALPRFVRPGDRFTAAAVTRVVEGQGGGGTVEVAASGATIDGERPREVRWEGSAPARIEFPVRVDEPKADAAGAVGPAEIEVRAAVARSADGARDAFAVKLPVRPDRGVEVTRVAGDLAAPGASLAVAAPAEPARTGTLSRKVLVSAERALVPIAGALSFFADYPYGCTEQRLSAARSRVALRRLRDLLGEEGGEAALAKAVRDVTDWLPLVVDAHGLVGYWPGTRGTVSLTAWTLEFLVEARQAGFTVEPKLFDALVRTLEQALRSDYSNFLDGEAYLERAYALEALAAAGKFNPAYAAELARRAQYLDAEGAAEVALSFARSGDTSSSVVGGLVDKLDDSVVLRLHEGREIYGGLEKRGREADGLVIPSETRTVARIARALAAVRPGDPRLEVLVRGLVTLGRGDGWGSTNANAEAVLALASRLVPPLPAAAPAMVRVRLSGEDRALEVGRDAPLARLRFASGDAGELRLVSGGPVAVRVETRSVPAASGATAAARSQGFVVRREWLRVAKREEEPAERLPIEPAGRTLRLDIGDVVEEHVQLVNPEERSYVAVVVPLAAGTEPLNPRLATAPAEAKTSGSLTREPSYAAFLDDSVAFYYDRLPRGNFDFYFRIRATTPGRFVLPAATAEMMYDGAVRGGSPGAWVEVARPAEAAARP